MKNNTEDASTLEGGGMLNVDPRNIEHLGGEVAEAQPSHDQMAVLFEQIEAAPPAPSYDRFRARLSSRSGAGISFRDASRRVQTAKTRSGRVWVGSAAAACLIALGAFAFSTRSTPVSPSTGEAELIWTSAPMKESVRSGDSNALRSMTWFYSAHLPRELAYVTPTHRVRAVLDQNSVLRYVSPDRVVLERGVAWFEVERQVSTMLAQGESSTQDEPLAKFFVESNHGTVEVVGTKFLVDSRSDEALSVGVWRGVVRVTPSQERTMATTASPSKSPSFDAPIRVAAGEQWNSASAAVRSLGHSVDSLPTFLSSGLEFGVRNAVVSASSTSEQERVLELDCVFTNRGQLRLPLRGATGGQSPLWIHLCDASEAQVQALPVLPGNLALPQGEVGASDTRSRFSIPSDSNGGVSNGGDSSRARRRSWIHAGDASHKVLEPGESLSVRIRFKSPAVSGQGCRVHAVYRGLGQAPIQSPFWSISEANQQGTNGSGLPMPSSNNDNGKAKSRVEEKPSKDASKSPNDASKDVVREPSK